MKKIAVDLDDVVLDFFGSVIDAFEREYGAGVKESWDGDPWGDWAQWFAKHPKFKESGYTNWWDWLRERDWLWATFPAVPGAIGGIKQLRNAGYYVECVTAKPQWAEFAVWKWLGRWRPPFNQVTIVAPGASKLEATDASLIVDDRLETCKEWTEAGRKSIWFVPWVKEFLSTSEAIAVLGHCPDEAAYCWDDVLDIVKEVI
jgi:FMN phosphatase YigB (HAD superfamily)